MSGSDPCGSCWQSQKRMREASVTRAAREAQRTRSGVAAHQLDQRRDARCTGAGRVVPRAATVEAMRADQWRILLPEIRTSRPSTFYMTRQRGASCLLGELTRFSSLPLVYRCTLVWQCASTKLATSSRPAMPGTCIRIIAISRECVRLGSAGQGDARMASGCRESVPFPGAMHDPLETALRGYRKHRGRVRPRCRRQADDLDELLGTYAVARTARVKAEALAARMLAARREVRAGSRTRLTRLVSTNERTTVCDLFLKSPMHAVERPASDLPTSRGHGRAPSGALLKRASIPCEACGHRRAEVVDGVRTRHPHG